MRFWNVSIDQFNVPAEHYVLTHWHADHVRGLGRRFKHPVACSSVTAQLLLASYPFIDIVELQAGQTVELGDEELLCIDANHLPGSLMLYFPARGVFYTGDYRLDQHMEQTLRVNGVRAKELWVDGTFHDPDLEMPSLEDSVHLFADFVRRHPEPIQFGVHHAGMCQLLGRLRLSFRLHPRLPPGLALSLKLMYASCISSRARITVMPPSFFTPKTTRVIASALRFACVNPDTASVDSHGVWRFQFSSHSSFAENTRLQRLVQAPQLNLINLARTNLDCEKRH